MSDTDVAVTEVARTEVAQAEVARTEVARTEVARAKTADPAAEPVTEPADAWPGTTKPSWSDSDETMILPIFMTGRAPNAVPHDSKPHVMPPDSIPPGFMPRDSMPRDSMPRESMPPEFMPHGSMPHEPASAVQPRLAVEQSTPPAIPKPAHSDRLPSDERNMLIFVAALLLLGTLAIVAMASVGR